MECQEFLAGFSDFMDGRSGTETAGRLKAHREHCGRCHDYARTLEAGQELLRSLPPLEVPPDFHRRLQHRILHLKDGPSLARQSLGSGASVATVLSVAVLLTVAAWAPSLHRMNDTVDLPAVVVTAPESPSFTPSPVTPTFPRQRSLFTTSEFQDGFWGNPHDLLREYSPILDRRRELWALRVGIE